MAGRGDTAPKALSGVARGLRVAHLFVAWLFVVTILVQVFFAGLVLFAQGSWSVHREFGYGLLFLPLAMLILAPLGRLPRKVIILDGVLLLVYFVQTGLPGLRNLSGIAAALHPVLALLLFGLATMAAVRARSFVPRPLGSAPAAEAAASR